MKFLRKKMDFLSLLLLLFSAVAVSRAQVQQEPSAETSEGTGINITCSHPNIQADNIQWYRQLPGRAPTFLVSAVTGFKEVPDPEGQLWVSADRRSSILRLARPRLGDAALYYCAVGAREAKPGLRPGTKRLGRGGGTVPSGPAGGAAAPPPRRRRAGSADMERVPRTARHPPEKGVPASHPHEHGMSRSQTHLSGPTLALFSDYETV
ncbi:M1-specific T cell receptor alpha chain-like [Centrocercus urophasianus]|uniref:M1-specific T cell receptor alpha chain-like n=1 Tax=Centrocercus urophasianus TaxID=9002 RepID=UPI001C6492D7|nr:M1-specific T cell receptor alpha chain-like [Centrocercus urophasianus]